METLSNDAPLGKSGSSISKSASRVLLIPVILYVAFALAVWVFQRRLIYFPTTFSPQLAESLAAKEGFRAWRNKTGEIIGWQLAVNSPTTGAVLIVHGNAGSAIDRSYLAEPIHAASPVDVFVLEYPGYGARSGSPGQQTILAAVDEAFETLGGRGPLYIVSESLGTGAAAHLARKQDRKIAGLVLIAPYDKLVSVGQRQMPFLPVGLMMRDRFNPVDWLKDYRGPVKVVLAEADRSIPAKLGQKLYDSYNGPKSIEIIHGADHNDISGQTPEWWKEVFVFLEKNRQR